MRHDGQLRLIFVCLVALWGSGFLWTAVALREVPPFTLVTLRLATGALTLFAWAAVRRSAAFPPTGLLWPVALIGVANVAGSFSLITLGQLVVPSGLTAMLVGTVPLLAFAMGAVSGTEAASRARIAGLVAGFVGVALIAVSAPAQADSGAPGAVLLGTIGILVAAVLVAGGVVLARQLSPTLSPLQLTLTQLLASLPITVALAIATEADDWAGLPIDPLSWVGILWLGPLGVAFANLGFYRLVAEWGVARTTVTAYLMPVVGLVLGVTLLQEPLTAADLVAIGLILCGVAMVSRAPRGGQRAT